MIAFEKLVIGNAAGMVKSLEDVERFCRSSATRITVGSITRLERIGNTPVSPGGVYYYDPVLRRSGNSLGLPNMGMFKYGHVLGRMVEMAHKAGKELWVSIVGEFPEEILQLVTFALSHGADGVEINFACPNVHDEGAHKTLMCENAELVHDVLTQVGRRRAKGHGIGVKIAPTEDETLLDDLAFAVNSCDVVTELVATNTRGGQRFIKDGVDMIAFKPPGSDTVIHTGGEAGAPLHAGAVWVAETMRHLLDDRVRVVGVGGIFDGKDALDFISRDCGGIQCATAIMEHTPGEAVLYNIANELLEYMPQAA